MGIRVVMWRSGSLTSLIAGRYDNIDTWVDWLIIAVLCIVGMTIWVWADRWWNRRKQRQG